MDRRSEPLIVAIDGPSGAGKSSAARAVARRFGVPYLETGAMYRAVAVKALDEGIDPDDAAAVAALVPRLDVTLELDAVGGRYEVRLDGRDPGSRLRSAEVAEASSRLSVHPDVRSALVERQREAARRQGAVVEGRDIGTVVFPETPFKFFLVAAPEVRAERRRRQLSERGEAPPLAAIEEAQRTRDARDAGREASPLRPHAASVLVDTSRLTLEEVVEHLVQEIENRRRAAEDSP